MARTIQKLIVPASVSAALLLASCSSDDTADTGAAETTVSETTSTEAETTVTEAETTTTEADTTTVAETVAEATPSGEGEIVINQAGLFPEGLSYDPTSDRFVVGSLLAGQLLWVDQDGTLTPVADAPATNLTGVEVDVERNRILVAVTRMPNGVAQLSIHDLTTGAQTELIDLGALDPEATHFANGITFDDEGNVYVTDTAAGVIYRVDADSTPTIFAENEAFTPVQGGLTASGLNGIAAIDGALIVGHSPTGQLLRVPLDDPTTAVPIETGVEGMAIDGIHISDDGGTMAVVSNRPGSVHMFETTDDWVTATEVENFDVGGTFPTTITDRDGTFYVLQAHLNQMAQQVDEFEIVPLNR